MHLCISSLSTKWVADNEEGAITIMSEFNANVVPVRPRRGFVEGDYTLELISIRAGQTSVAKHPQIAIEFALRTGAGYENARVWEWLVFSPMTEEITARAEAAGREPKSGFAMVIDIMREMGLNVTTVQGDTAIAARDAAMLVFPAQGARLVAHVRHTADGLKAVWYTEFK